MHRKIPFRLGSTSYVYDADLVTNARQLAGVVDDMELVLFETDNYGSNFPSPAQVAELRQIGQANDLSYTVHLPVDLKWNDAKGNERIRRVIDATRPLAPPAYVLHLDGGVFLTDTYRTTIARWQEEARMALQSAIAWVGDARQICVENVERWDPDYFQELVTELHISRCVDVGHLWLEGCDPLPHLRTHLERTRVIHLHGVRTRAHHSLSQAPDSQLLPLVKMLVDKPYRGVVTLEVFGQEDFFSSRDVLLNALERIEDARDA